MKSYFTPRLKWLLWSFQTRVILKIRRSKILIIPKNFVRQWLQKCFCSLCSLLHYSHSKLQVNMRKKLTKTTKNRHFSRKNNVFLICGFQISRMKTSKMLLIGWATFPNTELVFLKVSCPWMEYKLRFSKFRQRGVY